MIVIQPFARQLTGGKPNPKNYPWWESLIHSLISLPEGVKIVQVGQAGEKQLVGDFRADLTLEELETLLCESTTFIGIDSFLQHLAWTVNKKGIVLFGPSDPLIFGHDLHVNLQADRKYLRRNQFHKWDECLPNSVAFVTPNKVITSLREHFDSL